MFDQFIVKISLLEFKIQLVNKIYGVLTKSEQNFNFYILTEREFYSK